MNVHDSADQQREAAWTAEGGSVSLWAQKPAVVHMDIHRGGSGILGDSLEEDLLQMPEESCLVKALPGGASLT